MGSSIANLAVKLSLEGSQYESGIKVAESSTRRWGGSLDGIIQKMEMQSQGLEETSRRAAIFSAAQKGASSATIDYALSLDKQLESMEKLAVAEAAAAQAEKTRRSGIHRVVESLREEYLALSMNAAQLQEYKLEQLGASETTIKHVRSLIAKIEALKAEKLALNGVGMAQRDANQNMASLTMGAARGQMVMMQLAFAVEDAATVYGDMGLAGAVRASANNLVMAAMMVNPLAGIYAAVASTVLQLGIAFAKNAQSTEEQIKANERLEKSLNKIQKAYEGRLALEGKLSSTNSSKQAGEELRKIEADIENQENKVNRARMALAMEDEGWKEKFKNNLPGAFLPEWTPVFGIGEGEHKKHNTAIEELNASITEQVAELDRLNSMREKFSALQENLAGEESFAGAIEAQHSQAMLDRKLHDEKMDRLKELANQFAEMAEGPIDKYNKKLNELLETYDAGLLSEGQFQRDMAKLDKEYLKPSAAAEKYIENAMTPLQKYEKELNKLQEELAQGNISESVYDKNAKSIFNSMSKPEKMLTSAGAAASEGSREAYSAIASAITGEQSRDSMKTLSNTAAQQLAEAKKQTSALEEVRRKLEPVEAAKL